MSFRSSKYNSPKKYEYINGRKWYYYLKPNKKKRVTSLSDQHSWEQIRNGMVVHLTQGDKRLFTLFQDQFQFLKYEEKIAQTKRCFFETVFGQSPQKPHFDIDINLIRETSPRINQEVEEMMDQLISAIISVMEGVGINLNPSSEILIFASHGKKKKSFHIVIDHYYHTDHKEAKAFYQLVISKVSYQYRRWIDRMVYSSLQQFRLEGSQKIGSGRIKTLQEEWKWNHSTVRYKFPETPINPFHRRGMIFSASLLSYSGAGQILPPFINSTNSLTGTNYDSLSLSDREGIMALEMVAKLAGVNISNPSFPYQFMKMEGGLVVLKRIHPSTCRICDRVHENENPYLIITGKDKNVYFDCRRNEENRRLFIGKLSTGTTSENSELSNKNEPTIKELMNLPVIVPTVDIDGAIIPISKPSPVSSFNSTNIPLIIPQSQSTVEISIHTTIPTERKSLLNDLQILSKGFTYQTKSGRIRGTKKKLSGVYSPPVDLLKNLKF